MSDKYKAYELGELYFVTVTVVDWADLLTRPIYKEIIIESLKHCQSSKGLHVHAFVIMSNHWHAILSTDQIRLSDIMRDIKKHTSKVLIRTMTEINESRRRWMLRKFGFAADRVRKGVNYKVWKDGFHPVHLHTNRMIEDRVNYIHQNPVEEGYVYEAEHYVYSSARDYAGMPGLLALKML